MCCCPDRNPIADRNSIQSGLGPFCSTSKRHPEMSLSCCSHRPDRTRHASAVRLLLLPFFVDLFRPQNHPSSDYLLAAATICLLCCTYIPHICLRRFRDQFVVAACCSSSFLPILHFSCTLWSFGLFKLVFVSFFFANVLLALLLLYHHPLCAFSFFLYYLGFRFTCYRCILCFITQLTPSYRSISPRRYLHPRSLHTITSLASSVWFGYISFLLLRSPPIASHVSHLGAPLDLCDFAIELLTS